MSKLASLYGDQNQSEAARVLAAVRETVQSISRGDLRESSRIAFSTESMTAHDSQTLMQTASQFQSALMSNLQAQRLDVAKFSEPVIAAARESAILAADPQGFLGRKVFVESNESNFVSSMMVADSVDRSFAREAYNEQDNATVLENTVTYQLLSGRQAPAAELFFPTISVPSDNSGISATIRIYEIHDDIRHTIDGNVVDFKRRNLIDAMIDHTILKIDGTKAIPVHRTENQDKFAVGPQAGNVTFEGRTIKTAPLAFGKEMNLVILSADDQLLATGAMDRTDGLDQDVKLEAVYLKVEDDYIKFRVDAHRDNNFVYVGQGQYREQRLNFRTKYLKITKDSKTFAGAAPATSELSSVANGTYEVRLAGSFSGEVNIETGRLVVDAQTKPQVLAVIETATGNDVTASAGQSIKTKIETGEWIGFDVDARRANVNLRERGELLNINYISQKWAVPTRSPVTALRPVQNGINGNGDADVLDLLAATTFARVTGAAYQTLFDTVDQLRMVQGQRLDPSLQPEVLGVGRWVVQTKLIEDTIDADLNVASLTSAELSSDISAMIVNRLRDMVYRLYRDSHFQAVVESGAAGTTDQPTVMVITDPMTARYLMIDGEVRTAGPDFKMIVKASPNKMFENKMFVAFGYPEESSSNQLNALHFGACLISPEIAMVLPISRSNGTTSKELSVFPRFRHIVNVPVLGVLSVKNLEKVVRARVNVNFKNIP